MTTPQEEAADAEATRDQLEQAAMALFLAAYLTSDQAEQEPSDMDVARIRGLLSTTIGWFLRTLSRAGASGIEGQRADDLVDELLPGLLEQLKATKKWAAEQVAEVGALNIQRNSARGFATRLFNSVGEKVGQEFGGDLPGINKVWITRADQRVRPLHRKLHGRQRPLDADFYRWTTTGQRLRFPGDPLAPLDAVIGCRCVLVISTATSEEVKQAFPPMKESPDDTER